MKRRHDPALTIAQQLAAGTPVDAESLAQVDPGLARGLARLAAIRNAITPEVPPGLSWGHLRRLEAAGSGGFGQVFRAFDPTLDRVVALKLKREDVADPIHSGRDFIAEAQRLARVRHPNVLAVHGASYHDGRAGLWADWIDGETVHARIERCGKLPLDALLQLAAELASALQAVHEAGIVHGDVKAGNVMLDRRGHAVLMDFGSGFERSEERALLAAGTPRYLAPEAARGDPVSAAVDLYALGVLLHRAACGLYPDDASVNASIRPRAVRNLLAMLLDADAARRPGASEVARRIAEIRAAPLRRAQRALAFALIVGLMAVAAVSLFAYWRTDQARRVAEDSLARANAGNSFLVELLGLSSPDALGPRARLGDLLDAAPGLLDARHDLPDTDRAMLLQVLAELESDRANDETAARLTAEALAIARRIAPDSDATLHLHALWIRRQALAGAPANAVREGEALLAQALDRRRSPSTLATIEFALAEAEFRLGLVHSDPALSARMEARLRRVLSDPGLLDARTEAEALRRLANQRAEMGAHHEAIALAERGLLHAERSLGPAHPLTALNRRLLAWYRMESGDGLQAEALFRRNLELLEARLGRQSRSVADDLIGLATALRAQGRLDEALTSAREGETLARALFAEDARTTIDAGLVLAGVLEARGHTSEAMSVLLELRARLERSRGRANRQYLLVIRDIALLQQRGGREADAARLFAECAATGREVLGAASPVTRSCEQALAEQAL